ncbi:MAG: cyclic nucleotide-binding domain-containing protein [Mariprofundaceae bacterium]
MGFHKEKLINSVLKLDWKFMVKLFLSGLFTALGIYQHMGAEKLELALAALVVVPVIGLVFTYLKRDMSEKAVRLAIISLATLFVLLTSNLSFFLALAFFMMLDGATQKDSIKLDSAFRWTNAVAVEEAPEELSQLLTKHRLFSSIPESSRKELVETCGCLTIEKGAKLIHLGEKNTNLFFIAKGHVRVVKEGKTLAHLKQGDIVGEVSASGLSLPVADVIADDRVTVFAVSLEQINAVAEQFPEFKKRLCRLAKTRRAELATRSKIEIPQEPIQKFVSRHQLFKLLPEHLQRYLVDECKVYTLEKNGLLIRQGEFNSNLYLIAKGYIHVVMDDQHVASLGVGDIVGEISASGISMPTADVVADSNVIAYAFPADKINLKASKCKAFREKLNEIGVMRKKHDTERRGES